MRQMGSHPLNIFFMNYVNDLYPFTGVHVNHAMFFLYVSCNNNYGTISYKDVQD